MDCNTAVHTYSACYMGFCERARQENRREEEKEMKGYKAFNQDWTCKGFQYEVGKRYTMDEDISICMRGFHFCKRLVDCFTYYHYKNHPKIAEVESYGKLIEAEGIYCTNDILIVREIDWEDVLELVILGTDNKG